MNDLVKVNEEAVEPNKYFKVLKDSAQYGDAKALKKQLNVIAAHIIAAKEIGQKSLVDKLSFTYDSIIKEQLLLINGISKFVYQEDVLKFLDNIKTVKIIELDRFPRTIPLEQHAKIKAARELHVMEKVIEKKPDPKDPTKTIEVETEVKRPIFDEFCVVFTDLTKNDYKTPKEKAFVARNKDPVVLGFFRHKSSGIKHDRFYFITDWEDDHCDLTFGKMIAKMAESGVDQPEYEISTDHTYIQEVVRSTLDKMGSRNNLNFTTVTGSVAIALPVGEQKKDSFWTRLWRSKK